jgi:aldehyde:ferredoxin oxidoreductase
MRNEFLSPEESKPIQEAAARQWEIKRAGCPGCNLQCLHVYRLPTAAQGELEIEGMHANSVRGLGSNLGVDDIEAILRMHWLVNEYGMDVDGVSSSMAFALECAENELLPVEQPGGVRLEWGDAASLVRLTEQIARREGFGALLGEGAYRAAQQVGPESMEYAMTTKKVGINEQGIRSHRGWALGIMTSTRGGGHLGGAVQSENRQISAEEGARLFDNPLAGNPQAYEGKGRMVAYSEGLKAIIDSLGLCYFAYGWYDREIANMNDLADLYFAASGHHISGEDLHHQGLRVHTLERYLTHVFGGFDRRDDMVPKRFFEMPNADGPYEGAKLDREAVQQQLDEYYAFLGWNSSSGLPDADAIHSYDLDNWVIFD